MSIPGPPRRYSAPPLIRQAEPGVFGNSTLEAYVQATTARDLAGHRVSGHVDSIGDDTMVISDAFGTVKMYHRQK